MLIWIFAVPASGQLLIQGTVRDAETREPLLAATLHVAGTSLGTVTNTAGAFELFVPSLPAALVVRHIGYTTARIPLERTASQPLTISLEPIAYALEELTVSGEDPALEIMRNVLARKAAQRLRLQDYYAEGYTRFMLSSEEELVQVVERISANYWQAQAGMRTLVRAERRNPAGSGAFRYAEPAPVPDFSDDDVHLLGFRLVGPLHPQALDRYMFTLGGIRQRDDQRVFDIYFGPKPGLTAGFVGMLAVLDSVFVVLETRLRIHPDNVRPAPIQDWGLVFEQRFEEARPGFWLPIDLRATGFVRFGRAGVSYPTARFTQVSRLTHHAVNIRPPDSLFADARRLFIQPDAQVRQDLFRWNPGLIPLTPREREAVARLRPGRSLARAFVPEGLLRRHVALPIEDAVDAREEEPPQPLLVQAARRLWLWHNRVDGWNYGLGVPLQVASQLELGVKVGYAEARKGWNQDVRLRWRWWEAAQAASWMEVGYGDATQPRYASGVYTRTHASIAHYIGFEDYYDYYRRQRRFIGAGVALRPLRANLSVRYSFEANRSLEADTTFDGQVFTTAPRPNPPIPKANRRVLGVTVRLQPQATSAGVRLHFEGAPDAWQAAAGYARVTGAWHASVLTLFRRRAWPSRLSWWLRGGWSWGAVPGHRLGALDGTLGPFASPGSFRARRELPYVSSRYVGLFAEHDFGTGLFEGVGAWWLSQAGMRLVVYGGAGRTWVGAEEQAPALYRQSDGWHQEIGFSLKQLFNYPVRFDVTYRLDQPGWFFTFGFYRHQKATGS